MDTFILAATSFIIAVSLMMTGKKISCRPLSPLYARSFLSPRSPPALKIFFIMKYFPRLSIWERWPLRRRRFYFFVI